MFMLPAIEHRIWMATVVAGETLVTVLTDAQTFVVSSLCMKKRPIPSEQAVLSANRMTQLAPPPSACRYLKPKL